MIFWAELAGSACLGALAAWLIIRTQSAYQTRDFSGLKHHAKVHTFRFTTLIVGWALLIATFIFYPKYIAQCVLPKSVWPHAVQSISDWKNNFVEECDLCDEKSNCSGFFTTGRPRYSRGVLAITGDIGTS